jgi:ribosomal protein S18 acetylase RimI-like enzyme
MLIKPLSETTAEQLYRSFNKAFEDYERSWTEHEFTAMLQRRGYNPALSFGAFDGSELVSFTLNATGTFNSLRTAYDTGTGTLKDYRGRGAAKAVFKESLPYLKEAGIQQYLLEVLVSNKGAISVYATIGFEVSRVFNYFIADKQSIAMAPGSKKSGFTIRETDLDLHEKIISPSDYKPSWQNSLCSIQRSRAGFTLLGAFIEEALVGYGMIETTTGDIPRVLVYEKHRRKGIGTALLQALQAYNLSDRLRIINIDVQHTGTSAFLSSLNIRASGQQLEMIRPVE